MKSIAKILFGSGNAEAPEKCIESVKSLFENPVNIEWSKRGDNFEAIFYNDSKEVIVLLAPDGKILAKKMFLEVNQLPEKIYSELSQSREIMNVVKIEKETELTFEVIVRNKELIRSLLLVSYDGNIISEKKL